MTTSVQTRSISINGVNLHYDEAGSGHPALLFVHGWTCDGTHWQRQVAEFSKDHRVIALDQRGHGESDKPDQDYAIAGFADDLEAFIAATRLDRPVIVGHSMGGIIALHLARRNPEIARGLVLIDANIVPPPAALKPVVESAIDGMRLPSYREATRQFIEFSMFNEASDPDLKESIIERMLEAPERLIHTALASLIEETGKLSGPVPVPTLHLRASTHVSSAEDIRERHPGIEVRELDGTHFLQIEHPDEVNSAIRGFLQKVTD